jgi:hypothetical protein
LSGEHADGTVEGLFQLGRVAQLRRHITAVVAARDWNEDLQVQTSLAQGEALVEGAGVRRQARQQLRQALRRPRETSPRWRNSIAYLHTRALDNLDSETEAIQQLCARAGLCLSGAAPDGHKSQQLR